MVYNPTMKSEGVKDIVTWMEARIKEQKALLKELQSKHTSIYEVGEFYDSQRREAEVRLEQMVAWKVSTEKYMKKLRHEGQ